MAGINDVVDNFVTARLTNQFTDPAEAQVRRQLAQGIVDTQQEELMRQRVETIGLIGSKLEDNNIPSSVKSAYEKLLQKYTS